MTDYMIAGIAIALFSLIFTNSPFLSLIYGIAILNVIDWSQFSLITGMYLIASVGTTIYKGIKTS